MIMPQNIATGLKLTRACTIYECVVTVQLICVFVFAYAKIRFSHDN